MVIPKWLLTFKCHCNVVLSYANAGDSESQQLLYEAVPGAGADDDPPTRSVVVVFFHNNFPS